jgi:hypothetical protein
MLNWLKGLFGSKKSAVENAAPVAPAAPVETPAAPAPDMTGSSEEAAPEVGEETK